MSARAGDPFSRTAIALGLVAAVGGFLLFLVGTAFAPDFAPSGRGQADALSKSAVGYSVLLRLLQETGGEARAGRADERATTDLLVVTPTVDTGSDELDELLLERDGAPTLLVLPFSEVEPLPRHRGWVRRLATRSYAPVLADRDGVALTSVAGSEALSIEGGGVHPMRRDAGGAVILGEVRGENLFVLTDARLLNNAGLATLDGAGRALALLDQVRQADGGATVFDLTLAGYGGGPSLLKLMLEPPFVGLTACLLAAALLAGWASAIRFGAPAAEGRAVPLGKRSLVDNTAALLRRTGRTHAVGGLYADAVRGQIARARHGTTTAPLRLTDGDRDRLDRLAGDAAAADTDAKLLTAARALDEFKRGMTT